MQVKVGMLQVMVVPSHGLGMSQTACQAHRQAESLVVKGQKGARNVFICFNVSIYIHLVPRDSLENQELISAT